MGIRSTTSVAAAVALILSAATVAPAQERAATVEGRTALPLSEAIQAIARQASVNILVDPRLIAGRTARTVDRNLPVGQAIEALLEGTGLEPRFVDERTITIRVAQAATEGVTQVDSGAQPDDEGLQEVVVRGVQFLSVEPSTATKLLMDPKDIPQSIALVTEDVMEFASIKRFDDIYRVDASSGSSHRRDGFPTAYFRGFNNQGTNAIRIDGFRFIGNIDLDLLGFERFEVVKGPSSALFGQNTIGGTLNAVTKKPRRVPAGSLRLEGGNQDLKRAELDFTGPVAGSERWTYRLLGAYEDSGSFQDYAGRKALTLVPSIQFDLDERTRFLLSGYYNDQDNVSDWGTGLQAVDPDNGVYRLLPLPRSHFYGEPWNHTDAKAQIITAKVEHELNSAWSLRAAVQRNDLSKGRINCSAGGNPDAQGIIYPGCFTYLSEEETPLHSGEVNLIGNFDAGGRKHTVFLGVDYAEQELERLQGFDYVDDAGHGLAWGSSIGYDVLHPVGIPAVGREDFPFYLQRRVPVTYSGVSAQLLLRPLDRLSVLVAGRYNKDKSSFDTRSGATLDELAALPFERSGYEFNIERTVGQVGVTYELTPQTNVYANWGQTYEPSFGRQFDSADPDGAGIPLAAEEGDQIEIGLKASVLADRLSVTLAAFDMERGGISQSDRDHPGFDTPVGTQRSRGVELGASGELLPGWQLFASASILDAEFVKGEFKGEHAANAPKQALSVFTSYQFQQGVAQGFGMGLGYVHKSGLENLGQVYGHGPIHFDFGDINELDVRLFYQTPRWEASLTARNLLNDLYYAPTVFNEFRFGISANPGRTIVAGLTYKLF